MPWWNPSTWFKQPEAGYIPRKQKPAPVPEAKPVEPRIIQPVLRGIISIKQSSNYRKGRKQPIDLIVLHATAGGTLESNVLWLCDTSAEVSAHYVIGKDGSTTQLVAEKDCAWHSGTSMYCGKRGVNDRSIGIELVNKNDGKDPYPRAQLESCMWICLNACKKHSRLEHRPTVVGHFDVAPKRKTDPRNFPWQEFLPALAKHVQAHASEET